VVVPLSCCASNGSGAGYRRPPTVTVGRLVCFAPTWIPAWRVSRSTPGRLDGAAAGRSTELGAGRAADVAGSVGSAVADEDHPVTVIMAAVTSPVAARCCAIIW
jgi:hypothetical protein